MGVIIGIICSLLALAGGAVAGFLYRQNVTEKKIGRTEEYANNLLSEAMHKAEEKKKEAILEAKEEIIRLKSELDKEVRDRRNEQTKQERRLVQREEMLDKRNACGVKDLTAYNAILRSKPMVRQPSSCADHSTTYPIKSEGGIFMPIFKKERTIKWKNLR